MENKTAEEKAEILAEKSFNEVSKEFPISEKYDYEMGFINGYSQQLAEKDKEIEREKIRFAFDLMVWIEKEGWAFLKRDETRNLIFENIYHDEKIINQEELIELYKQSLNK